MEIKSKKQVLLNIIAIFFLVAISNPVLAGVKASFLYELSSFTGPIPFGWPRVSVDRERTEIYVLYQNLVRVFNQTGMEVYRFGDEGNFGNLADVSTDRDGNIWLLQYRWSDSAKGNGFEIIRCNFRGDPVEKLEIRNLPAGFSEFYPDRLICRGGDLYLSHSASMRVVVTDINGVFKKSYDILPLLELDVKESGDLMIAGFSVDREGSLLFTIPPIFKAFKISSDQKVGSFGRPGSAPGRFNVIAGIVSDNRGNVLVVDKLKCAVMIFDKNYNFITQIGSRGFKPGQLIAPDHIAIDRQDRIYVTQAGKKGVSVYRLIYD
jgi:hypothetical protein